MKSCHVNCKENIDWIRVVKTRKDIRCKEDPEHRSDDQVQTRCDLSAYASN